MFFFQQMCLDRPLDATVRVTPAAKKSGFKSEMGLAVMMFPETA